jgi:hypothetical protein
MGGSSPQPAPTAALIVQLSLLAMFWGVLALHLLRLLAVPLLSDPHPVGDAARAGVAAGMVYLLFPGTPAAAHRLPSVLFGAAAVCLLLSLSLRVRRGRPTRPHELVLLGGNAAMALLLASGATLGPSAALIAAVCLGATTWPLVRTAAEPPGHGRHRRDVALRPAPQLAPKQHRLLVTAPQMASVAMTLGMAWMLIQ